MSRRSLPLALVAAFLVLTMLLARICLGSLRQEIDRVGQRYRVPAEAIGESVKAELVHVLEKSKGGALLRSACILDVVRGRRHA